MDVLCYVITVINCGGICDPDNGTVLISSSTEGGVATYFCDDGYELEGNTSRECLPDGQWSGNETFCKGSYSTLACHWYV